MLWQAAGRVRCGVFVEGGHPAAGAVDWKHTACEHSLPQRVRSVGCHASCVHTTHRMPHTLNASPSPRHASGGAPERLVLTASHRGCAAVPEGLLHTSGYRLSDSNGVILAVKALRLVPQRVLRCQKTFV